MNKLLAGSIAATFFIGASGSALAEWKNPAERYLEVYKDYTAATCPIGEDGIQHFVYFARDREQIRGHTLLNVERFGGAQIMYSWRELEPTQGQYDFSSIRKDVDYLALHGKRLFVQLQDASFYARNLPVPDYLLSDAYGGGATICV